MAVTTIAVGAAAASAYSGYKGAKAQQKAANAAVDAASRTADLGNIRGVMGDFSITGGPGAVNLNLGERGNEAFSLFGNLARNSALLAGVGNNLPPDVAFAAQQAQNAFGRPVDSSILERQGLLTSDLRTAFERATRGLNGADQPFNQGFQNLAFQGAQNQAALAGTNFDTVRADTLANLRNQAEPFEARSFQNLQNQLFATGRLGSTGGALQTEAFARGLGQADLSRQLEATNQARLSQQNALSLSQGLAGLGNQNAITGDALLQGAFGRFSGLAGQLDQQIQQRFGNSVLLNQIGREGAQQNLTNQITLAGLPAGLQSAQLANALTALQGQGALQGLGLNLFNAGLASAQAQGNLSLGQQSNLVGAASNPNLGATNDFLGSLFGGIATRAGSASGSGILGSLGGLFGNGGKVATPTTPPAGYS